MLCVAQGAVEVIKDAKVVNSAYLKESLVFYHT